MLFLAIYPKLRDITLSVENMMLLIFQVGVRHNREQAAYSLDGKIKKPWYINIVRVMFGKIMLIVQLGLEIYNLMKQSVSQTSLGDEGVDFCKLRLVQ